MNPTLRFCLVLHNHQPIGNFDSVYEQAYQDSYLPFLDVFEPYSDLAISLHTSGPLMEWLDQRHPEYLDRLARLVQAGRVEIVGGAFYEPILTMIPPRDRVGQIASFTRWLEDRLGGKTRGMWIPERVWEQSLASDIAAAGVRYIVLDDFHFRNAGLAEGELHGYFLSEDNGRVLSIFPGDERLRYLIPFGEPQATIDHLRQWAARRPGAVIVFGDDGEKFGTWPETKKHVYEHGWLRRFLDTLVANKDWLKTSTLAEAHEATLPAGKIYLPDGSYREMTEWVLPVDLQVDYDKVVHEMEHDPRWPRLRRFVRGGFWRNFKTRYPETNEMYCRMMTVSQRLETLEADGARGETLDHARRELYRAQCNCGYWHGAFGGVYLPHLRNAVYNHLIAADNLLDQVENAPAAWVDAAAGDYNFDARQEVRLANDQLYCWLAPASGGALYELDVRSICLNLLATIARRPEAYHRKVLAGPSGANGQVASIHDRVVFKQAGLDQRLHYDRHPRKSLVDHFFALDATLESVYRSQAEERGDFVGGVYESKVRRNPNRVQVQLWREGRVDGAPVKITKGVTLEAGQNRLEIAYLLEGLPQDRVLHFAPEFNFAAMPANLSDRYFFIPGQARLGHLGSKLDLDEARALGLTDEWLGVEAVFSFSRATPLWTYPIETVSQSEGGFELVHQSTVVQPHWLVQGDSQGRWSATLTLTLDTSLARERAEKAKAVAAV